MAACGGLTMQEASHQHLKWLAINTSRPVTVEDTGLLPHPVFLERDKISPTCAWHEWLAGKPLVLHVPLWERQPTDSLWTLVGDAVRVS